MEFVVKIQSEGEQKKFKLISFTHWQFIVSYHKAVVNHKLYSEKKTNIYFRENNFSNSIESFDSKLWDYWARRKFLSANPLISKRIKCIFEKKTKNTSFSLEKVYLLSKKGRFLHEKSTFLPNKRPFYQKF